MATPGQGLAGFAVKTGCAGTLIIVIETVAEAVQPLNVPVTVYIVEVVGLAVTLAPVVALRPVAGAHAYVVDVPDAVTSTPLPPLQIAAEVTSVLMVGA